MTRAVRALLVGGVAALRAPWWTGGHRLQALLCELPTGAPAPDRQDLALRSARLVLRLLARLPGSRWRNTCLFRSVAECLVLRHYGIRCRVAIGVRRGGPSDTVEAHAWVVRDGVRPGAAHVPLAPIR